MKTNTADSTVGSHSVAKDITGSSCVAVNSSHPHILSRFMITRQAGMQTVANGAKPRGRATRLVREQESLEAVIESIGGETELRPLLTRILASACELIGADDGAIGLVDA